MSYRTPTTRLLILVFASLLINSSLVFADKQSQDNETIQATRTIALKSNVEVTQEERARFANKDTGALAVLGKRDDFERFTNKTSLFFAQMLTALAKQQNWADEKTKEIKTRISEVKLNDHDGNNARKNNRAAQDRLIRVLKILQEASGFDRPLLTKDAYENFLQPTLAIAEMKQEERARFANKDTGALVVLGVRDGFRGFTSNAPAFFEQMLTELAKQQNWPDKKMDEIKKQISQVKLNALDGNSARSKNSRAAQDRLIRVLKILQEASGFGGPLLTKDAYENFLEQTLRITLKSNEEVTQEERAQFAHPETGALAVFGERDGFERFTNKTPLFFDQILTELAKQQNWAVEKTEEIKTRISKVKLNAKDGSMARENNWDAQDRLIRVLKILQKASGFGGPLLPKDAYENFLQPTLAIAKVTQAERDQFANKDTGALVVLGVRDGFRGFTSNAPAFFEQMLTELAKQQNWPDKKMDEIKTRISEVMLNDSDGNMARSGNNRAAQDRLIRVLKILQEASGFDRPLLTKTAFEDFLRQKLEMELAEVFRDGRNTRWDEQTAIEFMEFLQDKLLKRRREKDPSAQWKSEDWYDVTRREIAAAGGAGLLAKYQGSPSALVMAIIPPPPEEWDKRKFRDHKTQNQIESYLKDWLKDTGHEITSDDRKTHGLKFKNNRRMEADIFVPELKLVIEYQGIHHYEPIHGEERLKRQQTNDQEKREAFLKAGYVLIEIPYFDWKLGDSEEALRELILSKLKDYPRNLTAKRIERALSPKSGIPHDCLGVLKHLSLAVGR